jgi:hypothetical protein
MRLTLAASACARVMLTGLQAGNASCSHASPCSPKGHSQRPSAALQLPRLVQSGWQARGAACGGAGAVCWCRARQQLRHAQGPRRVVLAAGTAAHLLPVLGPVLDDGQGAPDQALPARCCALRAAAPARLGSLHEPAVQLPRGVLHALPHAPHASRPGVQLREVRQRLVQRQRAGAMPCVLPRRPNPGPVRAYLLVGAVIDGVARVPGVSDAAEKQQQRERQRAAGGVDAHLGERRAPGHLARDVFAKTTASCAGRAVNERGCGSRVNPTGAAAGGRAGWQVGSMMPLTRGMAPARYGAWRGGAPVTFLTSSRPCARLLTRCRELYQRPLSAGSRCHRAGVRAACGMLVAAPQFRPTSRAVEMIARNSTQHFR